MSSLTKGSLRRALYNMKRNELNSFILFLREAHNIRDSLEILWTFYFSYPGIINIFTKCRRKILRILSEGRDFLVQIMILTLSGLSAYLFYDDGIAKLINIENRICLYLGASPNLC